MAHDARHGQIPHLGESCFVPRQRLNRIAAINRVLTRPASAAGADRRYMKKLDARDPEMASRDLVADNLERLKQLFPEAWTEGRMDFEVLKQLLGGVVDERDEKYGLNWHGKRQARQIALTPSIGTLRPCPDESVDWDTTRNLMIEGDNLEVLKLLQKSYAGKVKMIYIDPPYNTGNDFVYRDNFRNSIDGYLGMTGQTDGSGAITASNTETSGRYHTDWLNMMYPRLKLARALLQDDGVICVSIDDNEQSNLRKICDEVFGEENHIATIVWQKRYVSNVTAKWLSDMHDFIAVYARRRDAVSVASWERTEEQLQAYRNPDNDPRGVWRAQDLSASKPYAAGVFTIDGPTGLRFDPPPNRYWRCSQPQFESWKADQRIWWGVDHGARPMLKSFLSELERGTTPHTWWDYEFAGHNKEATLELKSLFGGDAPFDTPKPVRLMRRLIELFCTGSATVLDFFGGSGTFAHGAMEVSANRGDPLRFILVQIPEPTGRPDYETIAAIAKERLRRAGAKLRKETPMFVSDVGFRVFKLAHSNIEPWNPLPDDLLASLQQSVDHLRSDRTEQDILFELVLRRGLDLAVPIEIRKIAGHNVMSVADGRVIACLATRIANADVEPLALGIAGWRGALAGDPETTVVFRDSAFQDDVGKTNLTAILEQQGLLNVASV
jgi:adenine-specific DNA-methyltransferase